MAAAPQMTLYGPPVTANYHRVRMILNEVGISDVKTVNVDLVKGEQRQPWFLAINPLGKIPVLDDGEVRLAESRAICRYLIEQYAPERAGELLGRDPWERALVSQWQDTEAQACHPACAAVAQETHLRVLTGAPLDEARLQSSLQKLSALLDAYEKHLSQPEAKGFLACGRLTFADLSHAPCLAMLESCGYGDIISSRPHVAQWWTSVSGQPCWQAVSQGPSLAKLAVAKLAADNVK